jgi:metal-responsive CopG/Arc/MetJ family transcriptional regulator
MNSKQLSITIDKNNFDFIENISKTKKKNRSEVIDKILSEYRKYLLKKEVEAGFSAQNQEDLELANSDFSNYLTLIEKNE